MNRKLFRYLHKTNVIKFTIIPAINQNKVCPSNTIITNVSLLGYVIHSSAGAYGCHYLSVEE